jgi:AcrR family transcriptional regulator
VQRFLDAAGELLKEGNDGDFTVQQVVERSGQSLRSFYQYFGGKHELLLALFEESIVAAATDLSDGLPDSEPIDRLRSFVVGYYRLCRPVWKHSRGTNSSHVMVEFAQRLLTEMPTEAARAFTPLVELLEELLADAMESGVLRDDLDPAMVTGTVLEVVMFQAFAATIGGFPLSDDVEADAEALWSIVSNGIAAQA